MFKVSETHSAATWLLDPRAPKVEMPKELSKRIRRMLKETDIARDHELNQTAGMTSGQAESDMITGSDKEVREDAG